MKHTLIIIFVLLSGTQVFSQHDHHHTPDSTKKGSGAPMSHAFSQNLPMSRNGSGTGWLPDSTPMYGYMLHAKKWMFMVHGNLFARYTRSNLFNAGKRGAEKADAVSWFMGMGQRQLGRKGLFRFSVMLSPDYFFGGEGYPLLFQTGESWKGKPLVDRQHPHDLLSELSLGYSYALSRKADLFVYAGYPGEPALGSVAFMHRVSSLYGPDAPLSHHWNDGTHITFGVLTAGFRYEKFKLEASSFTGREPDEQRLDLDEPRFDSYSGRLSFNPNAYWAFQVSQGYIHSPEALRPSENVQRTTASAVYSKPLGKDRFVNATALWGLNNSHGQEHAALLEAVYVRNRLAFSGRYEYVEKSVHELGLDETIFGHDETFAVNALSLGLSYDLLASREGRMAIGVQGTVYAADKRLEPVYGNTPVSAQVLLRFYPPAMQLKR